MLCLPGVNLTILNADGTLFPLWINYFPSEPFKENSATILPGISI